MMLYWLLCISRVCMICRRPVVCMNSCMYCSGHDVVSFNLYSFISVEACPFYVYYFKRLTYREGKDKLRHTDYNLYSSASLCSDYFDSFVIVLINIYLFRTGFYMITLCWYLGIEYHSLILSYDVVLYVWICLTAFVVIKAWNLWILLLFVLVNRSSW